MPRSRRIAARVLGVLSVLAIAGEIALYALAFGELHGGPSAAGFDLLAVAHGALAWVAIVVSVTTATVVPARRWGSGALLLGVAAVVVAAIAGGLAVLGESLVRLAGDRAPDDLLSVLLAVQGSGPSIAPAAVVLALAAVMLAIGRWSLRRD